jgi:hypothetical protein
MSDLALIANLPEVRSAVLSDLSGALLDAVRDADPESSAAVAGFLASALAQGGDQLGLGPLRKAAVTGERRACFLVFRGGAVVSACIEPPTSIAAVEIVLDAALQGQG